LVAVFENSDFFFEWTLEFFILLPNLWIPKH